MRNSIFIILSIIVVVLSFSLTAIIMNYQMQKTLSPSVQDCINRGGNYQIIRNADGSESGRCLLPGGAVCTDEQYYSEGCYPMQIVQPNSSKQ